MKVRQNEPAQGTGVIVLEIIQWLCLKLNPKHSIMKEVIKEGHAK